jgi:hypothetical protein
MDSEYYRPSLAAELAASLELTVAERAERLQVDDPDVWWFMFYKGADWGWKQSEEGAETWQRPEGMIE